MADFTSARKSETDFTSARKSEADFTPASNKRYKIWDELKDLVEDIDFELDEPIITEQVLLMGTPVIPKKIDLANISTNRVIRRKLEEANQCLATVDVIRYTGNGIMVLTREDTEKIHFYLKRATEIHHEIFVIRVQRLTQEILDSFAKQKPL